ncbi:hypothetical protein [Tranquillimonas alkanivorans]|uniref:hypothetical protein n=1 Tax=Tranquillimonas alkanivorans TaxID=441119 RepID=UPI000B89599B|nr:hypothetical protein [Tranquillimonas alkanivorans]
MLVFYLTAAFAQIGLGSQSGLLKTPAMLFTLVVIALANFRPKKYGEPANWRSSLSLSLEGSTFV